MEKQRILTGCDCDADLRSLLAIRKTVASWRWFVRQHPDVVALIPLKNRGENMGSSSTGTMFVRTTRKRNLLRDMSLLLSEKYSDIIVIQHKDTP